MLVLSCRLLLCFFALQKDLRSLIMTLPLPALLILQRGFVGLDLTVKKSAQVKILDICMSIKFNTLASYLNLFYCIIYKVILIGTLRVLLIRAEMLFAFLFSLSESMMNHLLSKMNGWMCSWVRKPIKQELRLCWGATSQNVFISLWNSIDLQHPPKRHY